jgi:hypothetical protein
LKEKVWDELDYRAEVPCAIRAALSAFIRFRENC